MSREQINTQIGILDLDELDILLSSGVYPLQGKRLADAQVLQTSLRVLARATVAYLSQLQVSHRDKATKIRWHIRGNPAYVQQMSLRMIRQFGTKRASCVSIQSAPSVAVDDATVLAMITAAIVQWLACRADKGEQPKLRDWLLKVLQQAWPQYDLQLAAQLSREIAGVCLAVERLEPAYSMLSSRERVAERKPQNQAKPEVIDLILRQCRAI